MPPDRGSLAYAQSWLGTGGLREIGALLVMVAILITPPVRRFFEAPPLQRLGELSFPIYLVHVPLIVAPVAAIFTALAPLSPLALVGLFALTCLGTLALGGLFLVAVERPLLAVLKAVRTRGRARLAAP